MKNLKIHLFLTEKIIGIQNALNGLKLSMVHDSVQNGVGDSKESLERKPSAIHAASILSQAELMFLPNIRAVADFFCCSYTTAKRWKQKALIPSVQRGNDIRFFIPDVMEAIEKNPFVRNQFFKSLDPLFREKYLQDKNARKELSTELTYETTLYPDEFVDVLIKYQGWRTHACFPYHIWNDHEKVKHYIQYLILSRHKKHPFPKTPDFSI
jgi:hypothetical protein